MTDGLLRDVPETIDRDITLVLLLGPEELEGDFMNDEFRKTRPRMRLITRSDERAPMATPTPNNPNPPKKPIVPPAKPGPAPIAKGVTPGKTNNGEPAKSPAKPGDGKPVAGSRSRRSPVHPSRRRDPRPSPLTCLAEHKTKAWVGDDGGNRKFGKFLSTSATSTRNNCGTCSSRPFGRPSLARSSSTVGW